MALPAGRLRLIRLRRIVFFEVEQKMTIFKDLEEKEPIWATIT
jgi:hypothetical protein